MKTLFASGACLLLGIGALWFVVHFSHRVSDLDPHGERIMVAAALTVVVGPGAAFILFASWRNAGYPTMRSNHNPGMSAETLRLGVKAGVYGLNPGASYRVIREIKDYYGTIFPAGMELTFVHRDYLPYHGGHTVVFRPRPMYLQDEENADVLNRLDAYLEAAGPSKTAGLLL